MAKTKKFDGVITAVRYTPAGQIAWVRAFVRHGFVFSDRVMLDRPTLIEKLKSGKRFFVGKRIPYQGASFQISEKLRVETKNGAEIVVAGQAAEERDFIQGAPVI